MIDDLGLGPMNGHSVGRILKEAARRAMVVAKAERDTFETFSKPGYSAARMEDVFTSADTKAQEVYRRTFDECFPNCGIMGEEKVDGEDKPLFIAPKNGCDVHFTVDPIDGTRAYIRRQSHGIATMVGMVKGDAVISAYIGDVCANEVYGYRPGSNRVHRITSLDSFQELTAPEWCDASSLYVILRDPLTEYGELSNRTAPGFKNYEVMGSSIGTWAARLWKKEVGALLLPPGTETPWDSTPVIGISRKLGYVFMRPNNHGDGWTIYEPQIPRTVYPREHDTLIVHSTMADQFAIVP